MVPDSVLILGGESIFISYVEHMSADIQEIYLNQIYLSHIVRRTGN